MTSKNFFLEICDVHSNTFNMIGHKPYFEDFSSPPPRGTPTPGGWVKNLTPPILPDFPCPIQKCIGLGCSDGANMRNRRGGFFILFSGPHPIFPSNCVLLRLLYHYLIYKVIDVTGMVTNSS